MYEAFYGFREKPFSLLPDPAFLYLSKRHRRALGMLEYGLMNRAGFTVITGEIGSGKTTLVRHLLKKPPQDIRLGFVANTRSSNFDELLQWILLGFKLEYRNKGKVELYQTLIDFVINNYNQGRRVVLIMDEAQNIGAELLEELRMLSNMNSDNALLLQIILVGQPNLREVLSRPELEQFAQRVAADYHLQELESSETKDYIRHRIMVAGGDPDLFDEAGCKTIWYHSKGKPRLINVICDTALIYGFAEGKRIIDNDLICDVINDKKETGLLPLFVEEPAD